MGEGGHTTLDNLPGQASGTLAKASCLAVEVGPDVDPTHRPMEHKPGTLVWGQLSHVWAGLLTHPEVKEHVPQT